MERNFKKEALKTINSLEEVKSVVCIVSDGEHSSACIGSEGRASLQNMIFNVMLHNDEVLALFKAAVIAAEVFKGEEK